MIAWKKKWLPNISLGEKFNCRVSQPSDCCYYLEGLSCWLMLAHYAAAVGNDTLQGLNHKNPFRRGGKSKEGKALLAITSWVELPPPWKLREAKKWILKFPFLEMTVGLVQEFGLWNQTDLASNSGFAPSQVCDLRLVTEFFWACFLIYKTEIIEPHLVGCPGDERKFDKHTLMVSGKWERITKYFWYYLKRGKPIVESFSCTSILFVT